MTKLPIPPRAAVEAMESFLRETYCGHGHGRRPTTAAPLLVYIVVCDCLDIPWETRETIARHLGVSKDGMDRAIRNALDRELIVEKINHLRRNNPKRPQDKHAIARRRYVPSQELRTVVKEALDKKQPNKRSSAATELRAGA